MNRACVCASAHTYMYLELDGGGEYKNKVQMWLMCLMLAVLLCEPYVTGFVWVVVGFYKNKQPLHNYAHGYALTT